MPIKSFIDGQVEVATLSILQRMHEKQIKGIDLYQCGSRFFAKKFSFYMLLKDNSDYDLCVQDGQGVEEFLTSFGFSKILESKSKDYLDQNTVEVWETYCPHDRIIIQVSVKKKLKEYLEIQDSLSLNDYMWMRTLSKKDVNSFWQAIYRTRGFGKF